jgi:hypothetical protein
MPQHREELLEVGRTLFAALAKEPTFIDAWINAAVDQPDLVVVYERWNETKRVVRAKPSYPSPIMLHISLCSKRSALVARLSGWRSVVRGAQRHRPHPNDA